jgi:hypothetical protein
MSIGDAGNILQPPSGGADGFHSIGPDCTGAVEFSGLANVK